MRPRTHRRRSSRLLWGTLRGMRAAFGWDGWSRVAALATAVAAVGALVFTAQSLKATQSQFGLSEQGQLTDRFGKAVEQLGSDKLDVRLGGIYALERLARDSERDQPTVIEVLAAFVRNHAPMAICPMFATRSDVHPEIDVQAALTVLGRRDTGQDGDLKSIDLSRTCLYGANLKGTHLANASFAGSSLVMAQITYAFAAITKYTDGTITRRYEGADLESANFTDANLTAANLIHAHLSAAYFQGANLNHASLSGADLDVAQLIHADLTGADLSQANLSYANLTGANLADANLAHVDLARTVGR